MKNEQRSFKLIMAGNLSITSTINAIIQATKQARENAIQESINFENFDEIHIFHTKQSIQALMTSDLPWQEQLEIEKISTTSLIHHVTSIEDPNDERFEDLVKQLGTIVNPLNNTQYYVDLTNGISSIKTILAVFAYVLDIKYIYALEVNFSAEKREKKLNEDEKAKEISKFYQYLKPEQIQYKKFPSIGRFDEFGKLNYTEILRHRSIIDQVIDELEKELRKTISTEYDLQYLKASLLSGVNSRLRGEVSQDVFEHHYSVFSFANAIEQLTDIILFGIAQDNGEEEFSSYGPLGPKLGKITSLFKNSKKHCIDLPTLTHLTTLITNVRNDVTHSNSEIGKDKIASVQSYLFSNLSIAFIQFITRSISAFMDDNGNLLEAEALEINPNDEQIYYFGFDGDSTGDYLEVAFKELPQSEKEVKKRSDKIQKVIQSLANYIRKQTTKESIIFAVGDNILFKAKYNPEVIKYIQEEYQRNTKLTSSIGFGKTLKEAMIAMRLAKAQEGNSLVGISLEKSDPESYTIALKLPQENDLHENQQRTNSLETEG